MRPTWRRCGNAVSDQFTERLFSGYRNTRGKTKPMRFGSVLGTLVAREKGGGAPSWGFRVVQPLDHRGNRIGEPIVAVDTVGSKAGDQVMWINNRDMIVNFETEWSNPIDAAIVGIVDQVQVYENFFEPREKGKL